MQPPEPQHLGETPSVSATTRTGLNPSRRSPKNAEKSAKTVHHRHHTSKTGITLHSHKDVHIQAPVVAQRRARSSSPRTATVGPPQFSAHLSPDVQQRARQQSCPDGRRHVELHLRNCDDLDHKDINALQLQNSTVFCTARPGTCRA